MGVEDKFKQALTDVGADVSVSHAAGQSNILVTKDNTGEFPFLDGIVLDIGYVSSFPEREQGFVIVDQIRKQIYSRQGDMSYA